MALRCKPNELAVISYIPDDSVLAFKGRFVTVVRLAVEGEFGIGNTNAYGPLWVIAFNGQRPKYPMHDEHIPPTMGLWPDAWLRPIRDDRSQFDETMLWKCGMPKLTVTLVGYRA